CSVLSNVSRPEPAMRDTIAAAPAYGVAGSPVGPTTRIGGAALTRTSPELGAPARLRHSRAARDRPAAAPRRELGLETRDVGELAGGAAWLPLGTVHARDDRVRLDAPVPDALDVAPQVTVREREQRPCVVAG